MIDSMAARASGEVGSKPFGAALSGEDLIDLHLDADLVQKIADIRILKQHADRADERGLLGDDVIAGNRGDVAAGGGKPIDHDHQRLFLLQPHQRVIKLLGAGGRAAGAVDMNDHGAAVVDCAPACSSCWTRSSSSRINPLMVTRAI